MKRFFILGKDELGKLKSEPVHIHIENNVPVRAPTYRYPNKAKDFIATMLKEMKDKE